jgi:peptidoglycan L-alanyl-D-glutamate endopeptidase CwlK
MIFLSWLLQKLSPARSHAGPPATSPTSSTSSTPKSTAAPTKPALSEAKAAAWQPDPRSARNIATLEPTTAKLATELLRRLAAEGYNFKVTSGTRTFAEQAALYAQGRTAPGKRVTNARPGYSWHNFGLAFDVTLFQGEKNPVWDHPAYAIAGQIGKDLGLRWGGDFKSIIDRPHFERPIGLSLAEARQKYPLGRVA